MNRIQTRNTKKANGAENEARKQWSYRHGSRELNSLSREAAPPVTKFRPQFTSWQSTTLLVGRGRLYYGMGAAVPTRERPTAELGALNECASCFGVVL